LVGFFPFFFCVFFGLLHMLAVGGGVAPSGVGFGFVIFIVHISVPFTRHSRILNINSVSVRSLK
jgi:hypothetical protein